MATERRYPVGIQTFSEIIREGYLYVDKTDLVWKLAHYSKFIFMSRPRRFGKSLLTSTLDSYFKGDRELFEGLKIMSLEKEWAQYPVIHLDLSVAKGKSSPQELQRSLILILKRMDCYEEAPNEVTPGEKLDGLIRRRRPGGRWRSSSTNTTHRCSTYSTVRRLSMPCGRSCRSSMCR